MKTTYKDRIMTTKKYSHNLLLSIVSVLFLTMSAYSQTADFVHSGPSGIFVGLGKYVPCGIKVSSYNVERATGVEDWKLLSECKIPATSEEFFRRVELNKNLFTGNSLPSHSQIEKLWQKANQTGSFDPADSWVLSIPVKIAMGMIYFDREVKENGKYKYRVTAFNPTGGIIEQNVSQVVGWPYVPVFDSIELVNLELNKQLLSLKWKTVGKKPASAFRVYCFEKEKPKMMSGKTIVYTKKDTTYYLYKDSSPETLGMKDLMCFLVPLDAYENQGKSSGGVQISSEFNQVFFRKTVAVKESKMLGITLSWNISNSTPARKIEVYRSLDPDKNFKIVTTLSPSDTSFTDPNVIPDKIHYYYLQACGVYDFQKVRSNTFFDYGMDPRPPVTPAIYKAIGIKNGVELIVQLNDVYLSGIRVYRSNGLTDSLEAIGDIVRNDSNSVVFHDTSSLLNGCYYYRYAVKSENTSHQLSSLSNIVSVRPLKPTYPETPIGFKAYMDDKKVKLFWDNGGASKNLLRGYKLVRREETGKNNDTKPYQNLYQGESVLFSNYYTDSTIEAGKTYSYNLQAVDIYDGISKNSATLTIGIPVETPIPPTNMKAINTPEGIVLEWGPAIFENLDMYKIYRYQRGNEPEVIKLVGKNVITYTDASAQKDQLYFYYLTSVDKNNQESVPCQEVGILR